MRVLVTGHKGYIGSVLVDVLRNARFEVTGLDSDLYAHCDFGRVRCDVPAFDIDLRDIEFTDLLSFDAVVHLASLPDDIPPSSCAATLRESDIEATVRLAECCKKASVSRLLFASTCAVYGRNSAQVVDEYSPTAPATSAAVCKLRCEKELARLAGPRFVPVILRNAIAYGMSPRMRMDLPVNDFVASAITTGRIVLGSDGAAYTPLIHVADIARAYAIVLMAGDDAVAGRTFNVAAVEKHHRLIDIADVVTEHVPLATRSAGNAEPDQPSLRVDGSKLLQAFPKLPRRWTLPLGVKQLRDAFQGSGLTQGDWRSTRYRRSLHLQKLIELDHLDRTLRPRRHHAVA